MEVSTMSTLLAISVINLILNGIGLGFLIRTYKGRNITSQHLLLINLAVCLVGRNLIEIIINSGFLKATSWFRYRTFHQQAVRTLSINHGVFRLHILYVVLLLLLNLSHLPYM